MKNIGIFANCDKPSAAEILRQIAARAGQLELKLVACDRSADLLAGAERVGEEQLTERVEALMVFGGDGTLLRAVRLLRGREIPVLGVNLGGLGFLTSVAEDHAVRALECLAAGAFSTSARTLAECIVRRDRREIGRYQALNDIVIERGSSSRIVTLNMLIDDTEVSSFMCDGLIISTPTGSTGHSLSADGPILHPATAAFVVSLICPHALSTRPLVVPDDRRIAVAIARSAGEVLLAADGQVGGPLKTGDVVEVCKSAACARFVHLPDYSYFTVLRQKLHWRGSSI